MKKLLLHVLSLGLPALTQAQDVQQEALKRVARFETSLTFVIDDDELLPGTNEFRSAEKKETGYAERPNV
jgi:hypothetical protein